MVRQPFEQVAGEKSQHPDVLPHPGPPAEGDPGESWDEGQLRRKLGW